MPLPGTGPTTLERVKDHLEITDSRDDNRLTSIVAAVNELVRGLPVSGRVTADAWPANITEGATMLAGRFYARRLSPAGVAAFGDFGPVYVQRNDPDVAMLLELGDYARPAIG